MAGSCALSEKLNVDIRKKIWFNFYASVLQFKIFYIRPTQYFECFNVLGTGFNVNELLYFGSIDDKVSTSDAYYLTYLNPHQASNFVPSDA